MSSTVLEISTEVEKCPRCDYEFREERPTCLFCTNCGGTQTCEDL